MSFKSHFSPKTHQVNLSSPTLIIPFSDINTPKGCYFFSKEILVSKIVTVAAIVSWLRQGLGVWNSIHVPSSPVLP